MTAKKDQDRNLALWNEERTPDPKYVKQVSEGRKFKTTDAQYLIFRATKRWGPYGQKWGLQNDHWEIVLAEPDVHNAILVYHGQLFYPSDDVTEVKFEVTSCGRFFEYWQKREQWHLDDEIYKKVRTNAMSKGLSWLGFAADIYMGLFDDNKYLTAVKEQFEAEADTQQPVDETISTALESIRKDLNDEEAFKGILEIYKCKSIETIPNRKVAREIWNHISEEIKARKTQEKQNAAESTDTETQQGS